MKLFNDFKIMHKVSTFSKMNEHLKINLNYIKIYMKEVILILWCIYLYIQHYEPLWMDAKVWDIYMKIYNSLEWQWFMKRHNSIFCTRLLKSVKRITDLTSVKQISNFKQHILLNRLTRPDLKSVTNLT